MLLESLPEIERALRSASIVLKQGQSGKAVDNSQRRNGTTFGM
jgi:hypothetical protein